MLNKKILITGGNGLVGNAFKKHLPNAIYLTRELADLRYYDETTNAFNFVKPEVVIHLAARVGGVKANLDHMGEFYTDNIRINTNVLEVCREFDVERVVSFLSTCIYPNNAIYPLTEYQIHNGEPHYSNFGYAYAKRMLEVQSAAYNKQYGCKYFTVIPNNLFGINDNFDLENSHVIPALIRKIHEAKLNNEPLQVWGDALVYREFTYADDIAKIVCHLLSNNYFLDMPLNIGNTKEYLLRDVIDLICKIMDFNGEVVYDSSKPRGQIRKPSCNGFLRSMMDVEYTSLEDGLRQTIEWFGANYPNVRGVRC